MRAESAPWVWILGIKILLGAADMYCPFMGREGARRCFLDLERGAMILTFFFEVLRGAFLVREFDRLVLLGLREREDFLRGGIVEF